MLGQGELPVVRPVVVALLAGDVSGDQNGSRLAAELLRRAPGLRLVGAGGPEMATAGVEVAVETVDLSFVGILPAIPFLRPLVARYRRMQRFLEQVRPDLLVLIDSEAVNLRIARWARRRGLPVVFFFPPQVWLWGRWRLPRVVPLARKVLSAFREEAEIYARAGADVDFVGHPLLDVVHAGDDPEAELRRAGLDPARPLVVLMPGSRRSELRSLARPLVLAALRLEARDPRLQFAIPLASETFRAELEAAMGPVRPRTLVVYQPTSYAILSRARAVLQKSGTGTLETALLGIPSLIVYRCPAIEVWFARRVLGIARVGMVNILLGGEVQPEVFASHLDPAELADLSWPLLADESLRARIRSRLEALPAILGSPGVISRAVDAMAPLLPAGTFERAAQPLARRAAF